jgi:hypothetical protein
VVGFILVLTLERRGESCRKGLIKKEKILRDLVKGIYESHLTEGGFFLWTA